MPSVYYSENESAFQLFFFLFVERYVIQPNVSIEWEAAMLSQESRKSLNLTNKQKKSLNLVIIACLLIIR